MKQTMTTVSAQKSPFHPRAAAATVTDVMRPPLTTVGQHDHVAAAAYLMKHEAGKTHARAAAPDHAYYAQVKDRKNSKRAALSEARKIVRQAADGAGPGWPLGWAVALDGSSTPRPMVSHTST
jgi:hypothetical protein